MIWWLKNVVHHITPNQIYTCLQNQHFERKFRFPKIQWKDNTQKKFLKKVLHRNCKSEINRSEITFWSDFQHFATFSVVFFNLDKKENNLFFYKKWEKSLCSFNIIYGKQNIKGNKWRKPHYSMTAKYSALMFVKLHQSNKEKLLYWTTH